MKLKIHHILLFGLMIRIVFLLFADHKLIYDEIGYFQLAEHFTKNLDFNIQPWDTYRTPGYPLFVSLIFSIFGINPMMVYFFQILLSLGSIYTVYLIGKELFNEKIAIIAALILSFEPDHLFFTYSLVTDTLFVFTLLLTTLFFIRHKWITSAILMGICMLIKPIAIYLPLIFSGISNRHKPATLFIVLSYAIICPWIIRNKIKYDHFRYTSITGQNLLNYNIALTKKRTEGISFAQAREELKVEYTENPFEYSNIQAKAAVNYIKNHKWEYLTEHLSGIFRMYSSMNYKHFAGRFFGVKNQEDIYGNFSINPARAFKNPVLLGTCIYYFLFTLTCYLFALRGAISIFKRKQYFPLLIILLMIVYFSFITGPVGSYRYKLYISPLYILLASFSIINQ